MSACAEASGGQYGRHVPDLVLLPWADHAVALRGATDGLDVVVWGEDDPLFPVDYAFFLKENIAGAALRIVPAAGHAPQLMAPALLLDWLEELHARTQGGVGP